MMKRLLQLGFGILATFAVYAGQAYSAPAERFEVTSIKAVRPTLVNTIAALQKNDAKAARAAFNDYDSAWNGIEVYINTRSKALYDAIEHNYQAKITKALEAPNPDTRAILPDAQAMLGKFDEAVKLVSTSAPLNPLYDDVARLRIVRAPMREVEPALKAGDMAKARKSYTAFDDKWDSIEDLIKDRSADSYTAIESNMIKIERALMADKPSATEVTALVKDVMGRYNDALAQVAKEARGR